MSDRELLFSVFSLIIGSMITFCICSTLMVDKLKPNPCPALNERAVILKHEKRQMFIDSMEKAKKKDVERLTDSLIKYRIK